METDLGLERRKGKRLALDSARICLCARYWMALTDLGEALCLSFLRRFLFSFCSMKNVSMFDIRMNIKVPVKLVSPSIG